MKIVILFLSIWIFIKTVSYGLFEIKQNKNKFGGVMVIILALISSIFPNTVMWILM